MCKLNLVVFLVIALLSTSANAQSDQIIENSRKNNLEEQVKVGIEDLIKSLGRRIHARELSSREVYSVDDQPRSEVPVPVPVPSGVVIGSPMVSAPKPFFGEAIPKVQADDKQPVEDGNAFAEEIKRELESLKKVRRASQDKRELSDFEKDELYYRSLMDKKPSDPKKQPEKRFLTGSVDICDPDKMARKVQKVHASRLLRIEQSRITADRVAEQALNSIKRKAKIWECLGLCGCGRSSSLDSVDLAKKRDVEVASSSSSSAAAAADLPGASISTSISTSSATAVNVETPSLGLGGILGGISSSRGGLYKYLISQEDYDRKLIIDGAIEDAAAMIRKLAYQTHDSCVCGEDPSFERKVLKLAIELVNKVTLDTSSSIDLLSKYRYRTVDEYLQNSSYRRRQQYFEPGYASCACTDYDVYVGRACPNCMATRSVVQYAAPAYYPQPYYG